MLCYPARPPTPYPRSRPGDELAVFMAQLALFRSATPSRTSSYIWRACEPQVYQLTNTNQPRAAGYRHPQRHAAVLGPFSWRFWAVLAHFAFGAPRRLLSGAHQASRCGRYPAVTQPLPSRYSAVT